MKKIIFAGASSVLFMASVVFAAGGFNQFGYNYDARIFSGKADGVDRVLDGKVWGDSTYANDNLVMKWNSEWDRGNAEGWKNTPYSAWENNEWNGMGKGGSGEVWHYKIVWVGPQLMNSPYWRDGGYPIWGQFEVLMDQGRSSSDYCDSNNGGHQICALAHPNGYGAN